MSTCAAKSYAEIRASNLCSRAFLATRLHPARRLHIDPPSARLITSLAMTLQCPTFKDLAVVCIGAACFAAGSIVTIPFVQMSHVRADSNRVFELRVYHTVPGKATALQSE